MLFHEVIEYGVLRNEYKALLTLCDHLSEEASPCTCGEPVLVIDPQTLAELDAANRTLEEKHMSRQADIDYVSMGVAVVPDEE